MAEAVAERPGAGKAEEGGSEPGPSQQLLQRLRELEAENSALAQANENQRETYERCLDEVANHVVQALLNQKDLRQECLKLKRRVFDLERQNQALSHLFQQKLQLTTGSLPQLALRPAPSLCKPPAGLQLGSVEKLPPPRPLGRCALQREVGYEGLRPGGPGSPSLEALSPFFKKKAQILEVLRKLEETDPLLCPPPWRDASRSPAEPGSPKAPPGPADPRGQAESPERCPPLAQPRRAQALTWPGEEGGGPGGGVEAGGGPPQLRPPPCCQQKSEGGSSSAERGGLGPREKGPPGDALLSALAEKQLDLGLLLEETGCYLQRCLEEEGAEGGPLNGEPAAAYRLEGPAGGLGPGPGELGKALSRDGLAGLAAVGKRQRITPGPGQPPEERARRLAHTSAPGSGAGPPPSPSKVLKFLKIPTPGEKPPGPSPLRLSPQLTRSSRIPCRSNVYEPCPSPVPTRRASPEGPAAPASPPAPGAGRPASPRAALRSPKAPDYENVSALSVAGLASPLEQPSPPRGARPDAPAQERGAESPPAARRSTGGSAGARWPGSSPGKRPPEAGQLPFQERLSALGKPRGGEGGEQREGPCPEKSGCPARARAPGRPCEEAPEARAQPRAGAGAGGSLKPPEQGQGGEPAGRGCSGSVGSRPEAEPGSAKHCAAKPRQPGAPPHGTRNPPKAPPAPPPKNPHGSPTKLPTKALAKARAPRPHAEEPKPCPQASGPPRPPPPPPGAARKPPDCAKAPAPPSRAAPAGSSPPGSALHSAIEEKVMKGIEENVLRRQGRDKGPPGEAKQRSSSSIASWFGLRRSKLPAPSRPPEAQERREWGGEGKVAARKLEAESLNISKLMAKAEDLRKALEEEKAYVNGLALEKGRPRACGLLVQQTQNQLQVMYQEVTAENFMQQLLNRVDGKEVSYESRVEQKRELWDFQGVSHDAKDPRLFRPPRNGIMGHLRSCEGAPEKSPDANLREETPSDDSLAESVTSQRFTACGSLTRTLDSGIGTFPPPDYCSGAPSKNLPRLPSLAPGQPPGLTRVPRKARTLEREVPSAEEVLMPGKHQSMPAFQGVPASPQPGPGRRSHRACPEEPCVQTGRARRAQHSKNWTFPNAKAGSGSADAFLCAPRELEGLHGLARSSPGGTAQRKRAASDVPRGPPPAALPFSGSRTPSASEGGEEGSPDVKSRDPGQGQPGLENSESLSDSLYDSLSSCGSQG